MKLLSSLQSFTNILTVTRAIEVTLFVVGMIFVVNTSTLTLGSEPLILKLVNAQEQNQEKPAAENATLTSKLLQMEYLKD